VLDVGSKFFVITLLGNSRRRKRLNRIVASSFSPRYHDPAVISLLLHYNVDTDAVLWLISPCLKGRLSDMSCVKKLLIRCGWHVEVLKKGQTLRLLESVISIMLEGYGWSMIQRSDRRC
jgi:hypothetical protein